MVAFMTNLHNLIQTWLPAVWVFAAIMIFGCGIGCAIPHDEIKRKSRWMLPWIVIGCGLALGAVHIAKEVTGAFTF